MRALAPCTGCATGSPWSGLTVGTSRRSTSPRRRGDVMLGKFRSVAVFATWLLLTVAAAPTMAMAKGEGERVGENLGGLLGGWAKSLYVGIAALVALVFLLHRRFADLAILFVAATAVGGFVLDPNEIAGVVKDIWRTLAA